MKLRFSDRIGTTAPNSKLIINEINDSIRNRLWNSSHHFLWEKSGNYWHTISPIVCDEFFQLSKHSVSHSDYSWLEQKFFDPNFTWYEIYNFIQYVGDNFKRLNSYYDVKIYYETINKILEEEFSGYRFIGYELAPITNESEIKSISEAIEQARQKSLFGTGKHFESALELLSTKPNPDYRNSIKESICAVESLVKFLTGEKGGGLDKALSMLDSKVKFHGGFKAGLLNLYGFTSDSNGIRHSILDEPNLDFDDAKYMLVSCSAFVNFTIAKAEKAGLLK